MSAEPPKVEEEEAADGAQVSLTLEELEELEKVLAPGKCTFGDALRIASRFRSLVLLTHVRACALHLYNCLFSISRAS